jgi:hypothetical protein
MTTTIEFKAWLDSPLTKAMKQNHKEAMMRFENTRIDEAVLVEREECAKVCDDIDAEYGGEDVLATWCAKAIRARGSA